MNNYNSAYWAGSVIVNNFFNNGLIKLVIKLSPQLLLVELHNVVLM